MSIHKIGAVIGTLAIFATTMASPLAANAQGTGRFQQCAVEHDSGAIIVANAVPLKSAVTDAITACNQMLDGGGFVSTMKTPGDLPDYTRVCTAVYNRNESMGAFSLDSNPRSYYAAVAACQYLDSLNFTLLSTESTAN